MINLREVEEAIGELENSSATYNNCMKLASLYIIRDEFRNRGGYGESNYARANYARGNSYGYYPIYAQGRGGNRGGSRNYGHDPSMMYDDDLMIRKEQGMY